MSTPQTLNLPLLQPLEAPLATVGVFGGSGLYELGLEDPQVVSVDTPFGPPSDTITIGTLAGHRVAFLPRHGKQHTLPPHRINYRANVWALQRLGVHTVVSPCAAGSLQAHVALGDIVVCDQYVDRTNGRADTFYEGPLVAHVSAADPFDEEGRQWAIEAAKSLSNTMGFTVHETGTVVVIQGPRFSTRSESKWFRSQGWEVINMTQYPEVHLVKELNLHSISLALITDYDCGVDGIAPVTHDAVLAVFQANVGKLRQLLPQLLQRIPLQRPAANVLPAFH